MKSSLAWNEPPVTAGPALSEADRLAALRDYGILDTAPVAKLGFFATGEQAHEEYTGGYGYYYYSRGRAPGMSGQPAAKGRSRAES